MKLCNGPATRKAPNRKLARYVLTSQAFNIKELPRRYLPPGTVMDIFRQYVAEAPEDKLASFFARN